MSNQWCEVSGVVLMNCVVFRSDKKQGAYLYLSNDKSMEDVPDELVNLLGNCTQVMELNLDQHQKLATEDINVVKQNINDQGYHLQMPPKNQVGIINYGV